MNKMHTLTKIILSSIGIFFVIRLLTQLPYAIFMFYWKPSWQVVASLLFSFFLTAVAIGLLAYFLIHQHDTLVKKIVGEEQLPEPDSQIQWLPVALRLICLTGGIYFLCNVLWQATYVSNRLASFKAGKCITCASPSFNTQSLLPWILMLVCGVYLLCGAPHFVRWHVKKISQMCEDSKQTK